MTAKPKLAIVPKPGIDIAKQWRDEVRQRDWGRVHIEGDRREPVVLSILRWVHRL